MKERENLHYDTDKGAHRAAYRQLGAKNRKANARRRARNCNFECEWLISALDNLECDWLIELSDNKLSHNKLTSKLVENGSFLNQSQLRKL